MVFHVHEHILTHLSHSYIFTQEKLKFTFIRQPLSHAYSGIICNCPEVETSPISLQWLMDRQIMMHPHIGMLFSSKNIDIHSNMDKTQVNYTK